MDWDANNFNVDANLDNGSCIYDVLGCTDPNADNFDPNATLEPADICLYNGCLDESALNYNSNANSDDGSCQYQLQIGDYAEGGIVFYVDESSQHGLVAAMEDLTGTAYSDGCVETYIPWGMFRTRLHRCSKHLRYICRISKLSRRFIVDFTEATKLCFFLK